MPMVTSGSISLQQIQSYHGGANPISINEYYRGGTYVYNSSTWNANIPTTGTISISNFYNSYREDYYSSGVVTTGMVGGSIYGYDPSWPIGSILNNGYVVTNGSGTITAAYWAANQFWIKFSDPIATASILNEKSFTKIELTNYDAQLSYTYTLGDIDAYGSDGAGSYAVWSTTTNPFGSVGSNVYIILYFLA